MSLRRLHSRDDGVVLDQGTKVHPRLGIGHQPVTPVEFLALPVPRILLRTLTKALSSSSITRSPAAPGAPAGRPQRGSNSRKAKAVWMARTRSVEAMMVPVMPRETSTAECFGRRPWW